MDTKNLGSQSFIPLILGANLGAYSLAREFHELYELHSLILSKQSSGQVENSKILTVLEDSKISDDAYLIQKINDIAKKYPENKILLMGCSDDLALIIMKNASLFKSNIVFPYGKHEIAHDLSNKAYFYDLCEQLDVAYPRTKLISSKDNISGGNFSYPQVIKPADQPNYHLHSFKEQKKVYIVKNEIELQKIVQTIFEHGYSKKLIIQEYIPGEDETMFTLNAYIDKQGNLSVTSMGNILCEEKTPTGMGNYNALVNTTNEKILSNSRKIISASNITGFINLDIKYNPANDTYYFFEMNIRQGNSHYFVTAGGSNFIPAMVSDLLGIDPVNQLNKKQKVLTHIVPKIMIRWCIGSESYKKIKKEISIKNFVNPLHYKKDLNLKRRIYLTRHALGHIRKYFLYYKK